MKRRQIALNALTTFAQTLINAASLFFLYRFLLRTIGVERLGIWSLVLATTSIVTLAHQGFSTSMVKFVAKYAALERHEKVSALIQTAVISIAGVLLIVSLGLFPGTKWILKVVLPQKHLTEALTILPLAFVSLWLNILEGVLQAALAGHQRITDCNYLEAAGAVSYLFLAFLFVPARGLVGLACAQTIQAAAILAVTWLLLRKRVPALPILPCRWDRELFRELAAYGLHFQLITASQALREPFIKALLSRFGGLALTGYYDLASRCVVTIRETIVQANQVLIPAISPLQQRDPGSIPAVYRDSYRLVFFLGVPALASLSVASPLISRLWIGHYEPVFVEFVAILAAGWLVNVLANPAYVVDLGTGALRWVAIGCAATVILSLSLGLLVGAIWQGRSIVAVSAFSLAVGYLIVLVAFHLQNQVPFRHLLPRESGTILATSVAGAALFLPFWGTHTARFELSLPLTGSAVAAIIAIISLSMWIHPMRKRLIGWVLSRVPT